MPVLDPPIITELPALIEFRQVISKMKSGKVLDTCGIPAEMLKVGSEPITWGLLAVLIALCIPVSFLWTC